MREYGDYALHIEHSGTFYTFYDLLTQLHPAILEQLDEATRDRFTRKQMGPAIHVRIPVKAGQVVGKVGGRSFDIAVINTEVTLPGFLTPKLYGHYAWRVHVVDPFEYFDEPLKSQLLRLNLRQPEPRFGRIDYDIDGRLVGNWFREGSGGYPGNAPDPAQVSAKDGLVKYELVYAPFNSNGDRIELPPQMRGVQGVLLAQLVEDRKLKIEVFPGKTMESVTGFDSNMTIYER